MVRRQALHRRGLPLLLGRRREQPRPVAVWLAAGAAGRQAAAAFRGARCAHGPLQLGRAESAVPAGARRAEPPVHLPTGALPAQFHAHYVGLEKANAQATEAGSRNWAGLHQKKDEQYRFDNPDLPTLEPWVNTTPLPSDALRARAQPLLPSRRSGRAAAALHRPRDRERCRRQAHPGEGRRGRHRPAGALPALRRLHVPEAGREAQPLPASGCGTRRSARRSRSTRTSTSRTRCGATDARRALPPRAVARDQSPRDQRGRLFRPGEGVGEHGAAAQPALPAGISQRVEPVRAQGGQRNARRDRPQEARFERHAAAAGRAPDGDHRRHLRREHRGDRRARADPRQLAQRRHRALLAAVAARGVPQARVLRQCR